MTKQELASAVGKKLGKTAAEGMNAVNAFTEAVLDACRAGEEVNLGGFAKFSNERKPARECINPQNPSGPKIKVPAKNVFTAKAAKSADMTPPKPAASARRR